jgi:hypothetical protein
MAVLGHSGSHAPQLMHSLVMTVAKHGIPNVFLHVGQTRATFLQSLT